MRFLFYSWLFFMLPTVSIAKSIDFHGVDTVSIEHLEASSSLSNSAAGYLSLLQAAKTLQDSNVTPNFRKYFKVFDIIALKACNDIKTQKFSLKSLETKRLVQLLSDNQYSCNIPTSQLYKLANNLCQGNYKYIYSRIHVSIFFWPAVLVIFILCTLILLNFFGILKNKFQRRVNIASAFLIVVLICLTITFKKTCNCHVTKDAIYGVSF